VSSVTGGSGDRGDASDGFRTYMMMLLVSAPVLIDDSVARRFLEQAQYFGCLRGPSSQTVMAAWSRDNAISADLRISTARRPAVQRKRRSRLRAASTPTGSARRPSLGPAGLAGRDVTVV
jgi:hypothetical protein